MTITKGDTYNFSVTVKDSDSVIFDLTGYTMTFTAKDSITKLDAEADISKTATISTPADGIGEFTLLPADTLIDAKEYHYDVQISDGSDNIYTVIKDSILTITEQITIDA
ncbi:MAG: hypothetical protein U9Q40_05615 [Campylobacterota bacterium]|nr:hypothetical protein [Campylobacterota bacterium]